MQITFCKSILKKRGYLSHIPKMPSQHYTGLGTNSTGHGEKEVACSYLREIETHM